MSKTFPIHFKAASLAVATLVFVAIALPILELSARVVA
jgi:hypothetical protein